MRLAPDSAHHLATLGLVANGARPCVGVQVIRAASSGRRRYASDATGNVLLPEPWWNDVVDMESRNRREQAVFARIAGSCTHGQSHKLGTRVMARLPRKLLKNLLGYEA